LGTDFKDVCSTDVIASLEKMKTVPNTKAPLGHQYKSMPL